jgi:hypothetical protein
LNESVFDFGEVGGWSQEAHLEKGPEGTNTRAALPCLPFFGLGVTDRGGKSGLLSIRGDLKPRHLT